MEWLIKSILWIVGLLGVVAGVLYLTLVDVWTVPKDDPALGPSLVPLLAPGDVLLVSRRMGSEIPALVRCPDPQAPGRFVIARMVGEAGDLVKIEGDTVLVSGRRSPSPRRCKPSTYEVKRPDTETVETLECHQEEFGGSTFEVLKDPANPNPPFSTTVETGKAFLVSDNRHTHLDSRDFGSVDRASCQRLFMRLWSEAGPGDVAHRFSWIF